MERDRLLKLIAKIESIGLSHDRETVLTLDEYFDGNTEEYATLCANTSRPISAAELWQFLRRIQGKEDVAHVLIRVYDYEDALADGDCWINTDTVLLVTSASVETVRAWFQSLMFSDVYEEMDLTQYRNLPQVPSGYRVVAVWWD
jgi:hypothetical protein